MNNKIIAAGVVVALCAVALIGVGYAYTATMTNTNTIDSQYVVLDVGSTGKASAFFDGTNTDVEFNTATSSSEITWTPVGTGNTITVSNKDGMTLNVVGNNVLGPIGLKLTTSGTNTFTTELLKKASIKFTPTDAGNYLIYTTTDGINWTCADSAEDSNDTTKFTMNKNYSVTLTINQFTTDFDIAHETAIGFSMTLEYNSESS